MAQDIRKIFGNEEEEGRPILKAGHEERFLKRLDAELPEQKKKKLPYLKIAASVILLLGFGSYFFWQENSSVPEEIVVEKQTEVTPVEKLSLGDLSPDLKKVENYYMASINLEISGLEVSDKNKALIDSFMGELSELNYEYGRLSKELNEIGPNDQTITAMVKNLQLRLQLLHRLKEKLNQLKSSKNGAVTETSV
ncbi:hypothetical protein [Zobellia barbeyronii]|uniref:Anti-sigma factor n=1 Tax=Zobellia barbeyronii TaxID=2748009 RepID=A0ABS5WJ52_9FLAO|nr:hypothetical protein [Zobellia barbeyronii]MBT2163428.1 hypothetical protein [Zobellia barbeyronii]